MRFIEYIETFHKEVFGGNPTRQRAGQFAYNLLYDNRRDLAEQIELSQLDPFYNDERIPDFFEWLRVHW